MHEKWTKFSKVMLWISFGGCALAVFIVFGNLFGKTIDLCFWLDIAGLIVVAAVHSFWGVFLEIAENTADTNRIIRSQNPQSAPIPKAKTTWTCPNCQTENEESSAFCYECGTKKPDEAD